MTDVLDGAMITIAMFTINIFYPGFLLGHILYDSKCYSSSEKYAKAGYPAQDKADPHHTV